MPLAADSWHPSQTYVATKKEIHSWIDVYGSWALYNGQSWEIKTKKIFDDRYEVTFKPKVFK